MIKKLIFAFVMLQPICNASSLEDFLKEANRLAQEENTLTKSRVLVEYLPLLEELSQKYSDSPTSYNIINQSLAKEYSFAGLHYNSLKVMDRGIKKQNTLPIELSNFIAKDAVTEIQRIAENHQILMINEAHHIAQHRVLTYRLLVSLWDKGFRYFAAEAFNSNIDKALTKNYPSKELGLYIHEPTFANLVVKAKEIGFTIISYDSDLPNKSGSIEERESNSAKVIKEKVFDKDPSAKVIIHVGYSHIDEKKWLASKLKTITNIETLTVDQTKFREKSQPCFEEPTYRLISKTIELSKPVIFYDKGREWSSEPDNWDITVFWPRTKYIGGRPNWADLDRNGLIIHSKECKAKLPCMVEVFKFDQKDELATDRIVISEEGSKKIFLNSGKNIVVITGSDGKRISTRQVYG